MTANSVFPAKWLGLYLVVISLAMLANSRRTQATYALVIGHSVWRGGAPALAVTLAGWAALLKGLWLLFSPPRTIAAIYRALGLERHFRLWMGAALLFGLALTFAAFRA